MVLKLWLPLNGDLHNQGLDDVTVTNNGATVNNAGKIGKCYEFGGGKYLSINNKIIDSDTFTVSFWINANNITGNKCLLCCRNAANKAFAIYLIDAQIRVDTGTNWSTGYSIAATTWTHITFISNGNQQELYINGSLEKTRSATINTSSITELTTIGCEHINGSSIGTYFFGCINDVRIYDHALSTKEIKELSKGLILHYTLSEGNMINKDNVTHGYHLNSSGDTTRVNGWCYTDYIPVYPDSNYLCTGLSAGGSGTYVVLYDESKTKTRTLLLTANTDLNITTSSTEKYIRLSIREIADELNTTAQFIYLDTSIYDVSGYQNNGTKTGTITVSSDTPRYNVSTLFNGSASYYTLDRPLYDFFNNDFTIAVWLKPLDKTRGIILSEYPTTGASLVALELSAAPALRLYWGGSPDWTIASTTLTVGEWSHIAVSKDDTHAYFYVNGELKDTKTGTFANRVSNARPRIGDDYRGGTSVSYNGGMSDLRLYSICLSANDILALYHTPASITSNGTLLTQGEIVEV